MVGQFWSRNGWRWWGKSGTPKPAGGLNGGSQPKETSQLVGENKGTSNSISYAETGGRNISPEQFFKEEIIAEEMYDKFRGLGIEDVSAIAKSTGFSVARIQRIKDHIFNNSHIKDHGVGKQVESDIQLLHHEIFESKFEGICQTNYRTAHDKTIAFGRPWNFIWAVPYWIKSNKELPFLKVSKGLDS